MTGCDSVTLFYAPLRLVCVAQVDDSYLPLKRNQNFIIKYYSKNREFFERVLGQARREDRLEHMYNTQCNWHSSMAYWSVAY